MARAGEGNKGTAAKAKPAAPAINSVWLVTREYDGLAGAGGVKDFCRQLAEALARSGREVSVVLPFYGFMDAEAAGFTPTPISFEVNMPYVGMERRETVRIWSRHDLLDIYLLEADRFREKASVYTYTAEEEQLDPHLRQGSGHLDYFAMNILLQKAALDLAVCLGRRPDIIHCQDGHAALLPAMAREKEGYRDYFRATGLVVTIHNAGRGYHQEVGDLAFAETITGLPSRVVRENLLDNMFDPFLAAAPYAMLNTVSENYARELRETDEDELTGWLGHMLLTRGVRLLGVTNGINAADFDPSTPEKHHLAAGFSPGKGKLAGKKVCRRTLVEAIANQQVVGAIVDGTLRPQYDEPLFTFIGRFTPQKGIDKLISALKVMLLAEPNFQILIQGTGAPEIEAELRALACSDANRGRVCVLRGYAPVLAKQVYAAGDFFIIPSRYEPCGLTDYLAQLFGNLPIVHHVGGLVKVVHNKTGIAYAEHSSAALAAAMGQAIKLYREDPATLAKMQRESVRYIEKNYPWDRVKEHYLAIYRESLTLRP